jgi:predicted DNA-binding transcriptional regulator AlpA
MPLIDIPATQESQATAPCKYMRPKQAAQYTGLSESTLAKLRMRHKRDSGPTYIKRGGSVIYRSSDLDNWMDQQVVD